MNRRQLLAVCGSAGIASSLFAGALLELLHAPVAHAEATFSVTIAPEMSGCLTQKVPPKPQQTSGVFIS